MTKKNLGDALAFIAIIALVIALLWIDRAYTTWKFGGVAQEISNDK